MKPLWPYQPWFQIILGMLEDYPYQLPYIQDIILNFKNQKIIIKQGVPKLVAWPVPRIPLHHEEFLHKLQSYSSHHGEAKPIVVITDYFHNGLVGMNKEIEI